LFGLSQGLPASYAQQQPQAAWVPVPQPMVPMPAAMQPPPAVGGR
jgi:hypothetical protein